MIFVTVGSQKFQFDRLLNKIDSLIENGSINQKVVAQIGVCTYKPNFFDYVDFMTQDEFNAKIDEADIVITHAGTGVIVNSVKKGKKVIGVPRLAKYGEHVDDHQVQLIKEFTELNFIEPCYDVDHLNDSIKNVAIKEYNKYVSNTENIIKSINYFIDL